MALTAQQEKFCQAIADGLNQSDSYRSAYNAGKMKDEGIHVNASKLMADTKVALRVSELRAALAEQALWTRQDSVLTLKQIAQGLGTETKPNEAVSAIKELNAMHGFLAPTKHEIDMKINVNVNFD